MKKFAIIHKEACSSVKLGDLNFFKFDFLRGQNMNFCFVKGAFLDEFFLLG
jgi:hypothetical protein